MKSRVLHVFLARGMRENSVLSTLALLLLYRFLPGVLSGGQYGTNYSRLRLPLCMPSEGECRVVCFPFLLYLRSSIEPDICEVYSTCSVPLCQ